MNPASRGAPLSHRPLALSTQGVAPATGMTMVSLLWQILFILILIKVVSIYSGSNPPTSFNSPNVQTFPLSRDSHSPPHDGGIRLPNAPLSDIASLQQSHQPSTPSLAPSTPHSGHSSPGYYSPPATSPNAGVQSPEYYHHDTVTTVSGPWTEAPSGILSTPVPTPVAS